MAVDKSPIVGKHIISHADHPAEKDVAYKEPPKTRKKVTLKTQKDYLRVLTKLKTLPRLNQEINAFSLFYERFKRKHVALGFFFSLLEVVFVKTFNFFQFLVLLPAMDDVIIYFCRKVSFFDELLSHQLDFVDMQLQKFEVGFLFKKGGMIEQLLLLYTLTLRTVFIWPRLFYRMMVACYDEAIKEINEDLKIASDIIYPPQARRSKRQRRIQSSPGKKRKHEEVTEEGLPEYMICLESYCEEDDPDYVPGSGDDTEITSATEGEEDSQTEEEDEATDNNVVSPSKREKEVNIPFIENVDVKTPVM